jgi:bacillithiol biosynthesis cysteine-adding enzyme BshC
VSDILTQFLNGSPYAHSLFSADFRQPSARLTTAKLVSKAIDKSLLESLKTTNKNISSVTDLNIEVLGKEGSLAIVSGQQIGMLGGPLLTFYKLASLFKLSKDLSQELGVPVIPVFWMQTEDHDLEEIASANFLGPKEELLSFRLSGPTEKNLQSVGKITLKSAFSEELETFLSNVDIASKDLLKQSYKSGISLSQSFQNFWQKICADWGIVFFDPLSPLSKKLKSDIIRKCIFNHQEISDLLQANAQSLRANGFEPQVNIKADSPLLFLELDSERKRLIYKADTFFHGDKAFSKKELETIILQEPERFTCSALIRPIFQDSLFPTLAYVCGPSEFNYWAQIKPLYSYFNLEQPLLIPRSNFRIIEAKYQRLLEKSGFELKDLESERSQLLAKRFGELGADSIFSFRTEWENRLNLLKTTLSNIDNNLVEPLEQTKKSILHGLSRLSARYENSLASKEANSLQQLERVSKVLSPQSKPQDRVIAAANFILKYGKEFSDKILENCDPLNKFGTIDIKL